jgi:nucleoid-associated protein YgaU
MNPPSNRKNSLSSEKEGRTMAEIDIDKEVEDIRKQRAKLASQREADAKELSIEKEVDDIRKQKAALAQQPKLEEPEVAQPETKQPELKDTRVYIVQPGDNLSKIAQEVYGNANRWREIFEANKDQIKDPSLIRPGQKLKIP